MSGPFSRRTLAGAAPAALALAALGAVPSRVLAAAEPQRGGLTLLAAALGELEPADAEQDMTAEHCRRQAILCAAAPALAVTSATDAALAISAAAALVSESLDCLCTPAEAEAKLLAARQVLARLGRWTDAQHGAAPLHSMWPAEELAIALPHLAGRAA